MRSEKPADDLAEVVTAIVAAYRALQRPERRHPGRVWKASGQIAPAWTSGCRLRAWKDIDRERGWKT